MKKSDWLYFIYGVLITTVIFGGLFYPIGKFSPPQKEYAFLKAEVMYGKLPPNTARVSKCFAEFVGRKVNWNGRFYIITGITGDNPFYPNHIYFSGNENTRIYGKRFIPVFHSGTIIDKIVDK